METAIHTTPAQTELQRYFQRVRQHMVELCQPLKTEDYVPQPVAFASPPKWHLAHTTWFFEAFILSKYQPGYREYDKQFSYLFNSYYNAAGERILRADRGNITRPSVEEVYAYRSYVDEAMHSLLEDGVSDEVRELVLLGLNHEQQHQELLITDIKHTLAHNPLFPVYNKDVNLTIAVNTEIGSLSVEGGIYEIGFHGEGFYYDNELGRHKVYINDFEIEKAMVTNGGFLEFMDDKGYERAELWLDEGWSWVNEQQINSPLYWHRIDGEWHHYTLAGLQKINPAHLLCHISFYETAAYAEWKGQRLPTEFEWEIAADQLDWGQRWEWTYSAYLPYPGFTKAAGATGEYNGKFMINQMVLRGASPATPAGHSRKTYRNFFHPQERWQFTGLRLIHKG